jgi:hypothetical protein
VGGELGDAYNEVHALHSHQYMQRQVFSAGASVCSDCASDTFSAVLGATVASTCANCVAMKYSAANASTVYTDCPAGKISAQMAPGDEIKQIGWGLRDRVCLVLVCRGRYGWGGCGSSLHSGIEFGRSRTDEGSPGGRKTGVVWEVGQERLGPSYFFMSLVLGPLNSLVLYVPSSRYTRGLGWRIHCGVEVTESSTNKQHISILLRKTQ